MSILTGSTPGTFSSWTVPDMQIIVGGDIAVAWGLNHMHADLPDGGAYDGWSRGTRVLQRQPDGRWLMIHQHVSYPYDPDSGMAQTELKP